MTLPLEDRLSSTEAEYIGRQFVALMRKADNYRITEKDLRLKLVEVFDDAREWGGEHVLKSPVGWAARQPMRKAA